MRKLQMEQQMQNPAIAIEPADVAAFMEAAAAVVVAATPSKPKVPPAPKSWTSPLSVSKAPGIGHPWGRLRSKRAAVAPKVTAKSNASE